jgi:sugar O-acyltransferase (sialic acid O-acetyltransferase NeuD family)
MANRFVIIGAGGQAREVEWLLRDLRSVEDGIEILGFVVSDLSATSPYDSRDRILGDLSWLKGNRDRFDGLALGIGSPSSRLRLGQELTEDFDEEWWPPLIHPSAIFDRTTCRIGAGVILAAGVTMTVNVELGRFSLANFGCTIGHESRVGVGSVINPGANISGGVSIGSGALIGTGAQVLQYLSIGDGATVGAGAVVTRDVRSGVTVTGIPARGHVRELA